MPPETDPHDAPRSDDGFARPDAAAPLAPEQRAQRWDHWLQAALSRVQRRDGLPLQGTLTHVAGLVLESSGLRLPVGAQCWVGEPASHRSPVLAEVVGFAQNRSYLMPAGDIHGLSSGEAIRPLVPTLPPLTLAEAAAQPPGGPADSDIGLLQLPLGLGLLGRVVDAQGEPLDGQGPIARVRSGSIQARPVNTMDREPVREPLDTGVKAINALLTVGRGQRMGLFAGSGVGKSVLLGMMARCTRADVVVVGLIGERGREVKEFIEDILGQGGRERAVVVAAPADAPPLLRMQGAAYASAIAEHYRDQGLHVLLLMDSLTRYAMAQREIALAIGEPPSTKGYPPSCFARLAQLVERSGNGKGGHGSVTGIYTVLSEGDDQQDPIADSARSFLDGHIVLSRRLAEAGHYPAIDVLASASRVMHNVVHPDHFELARRFRAVLARYEQGRDLVQIGAYVSGSDAELDRAIALHAPMAAFLQQGMTESEAYEASVLAMAASLTPREVAA